jgi:hypothetical protein
MYAAFLGLRTNGMWHIWLGLILAFSAVGLLASLVVGYLRAVVRPKYRAPKK